MSKREPTAEIVHIAAPPANLKTLGEIMAWAELIPEYELERVHRNFCLALVTKAHRGAPRAEILRLQWALLVLGHRLLFDVAGLVADAATPIVGA